MKLKKRLEALESATARRNGDCRFIVALRKDDETDDEARKRTGLTDHLGQIVFISEDDAEL